MPDSDLFLQVQKFILWHTIQKPKKNQRKLMGLLTVQISSKFLDDDDHTGRQVSRVESLGKFLCIFLSLRMTLRPCPEQLNFVFAHLKHSASTCCVKSEVG